MPAEFDRLQSFINRETAGKPGLRVLEAGCGSISYFHFDRDVHLVGIDISEEQLERNEQLDEKILGDVQNHRFPPGSFDVIVCVDVLEHLPEPVLALERFGEATANGGLVVLKLPNLMSVKGLATKCLPHSVHRLVYRSFSGGKGDSAVEPFRTYLRSSTTPKRLERKAVTIGLKIVYFDSYDITTRDQLRKRKFAYSFYMTLKAIFKFMSLGRIDDSEYIVVLKKAGLQDE